MAQVAVLRPANPPAPPVAATASVARLLAPARSVPVCGSHGYERCRDIWEPPASVPAADLPELRRLHREATAALAPAPAPSLLARLFSLLAHYRADPLPAEVEAALAEDWLEDLGEFPQWVVDGACRAWRRDPVRYRYRPLPGDLRRLCQDQTEALAALRDRTARLIALAEPPAAQTPASPIHQRIADFAASKRMPR